MAASLYRTVRKRLSRIPFLRSGWYFLAAVVEALLDDSARNQAGVSRAFSSREDPFGAGEDPHDPAYRIALDLIESLPPSKRQSALEIGCAEGHFTQMLAARVQRLDAVDFSPLALDRARLRCQALANVSFGLHNLREDDIPRCYDLIIVMEVLGYMQSPSAMAAARTRLLRALRPGDHLLVANTKGAPFYEQAGWNRLFLRGGPAIDRYFAESSELTRIARATGDWYVASLFRRTTPESR